MQVFLRICDLTSVEEDLHVGLLRRCHASVSEITSEMLKHDVTEAFIDTYGAGSNEEPLISCAVRFAEEGKDLADYSGFTMAVAKIIGTDVHPLSLSKLNAHHQDTALLRITEPNGGEPAPQMR